MSSKISKKCVWFWCALGLALEVPIMSAQVSAAVPAAQGLPSSIGLRAGFSVYKQAGDVLEKPVSLESQSGDAFLLALAEAGDINIICATSERLPDVQTAPGRKLLMPLLELARDGKLSWFRTSKKTFVMWPQPNEEDLGQSWVRWFHKQRGIDAKIEATSDEEESQALQQLKVADTPQARQLLRRIYIRFMRAREQRQVREQLHKYLATRPQTAGAALEQLGPFRGRVSSLSDLPPALRTEVEMMSRASLRGSWAPGCDLWFSPQRVDFWKKARLFVVAGSDAGKTRWLYLKGPDPSGQQKELSFTVGHYLPRPVPPAAPISFQGELAHRPDTGLVLTGKQMLLSEVLNSVSKQSGLTIEAPMERLSKVRLTLNVRGMQPQEFLEALARTFLIEWKVEGQRVTAHDRNDSAADRSFLQLGNISLYRFLTISGLDDYREEEELARSIYDEVGDAILSPEGVLISEFSAEVQEGVRREVQEFLLSPLFFTIGSLLPVSMQQAKVVVGPATQPIRLWIDEHQVQEIVPPEGALEQEITPVVVEAQPTGSKKVEHLVQAYQSEQQKQAQQRRQIQAEIEQRMQAQSPKGGR